MIASILLKIMCILKSRDITLPTKVRLVKAIVFPVVMYGCESWTVKKAECQRIDAFELWMQWLETVKYYHPSTVCEWLWRSGKQATSLSRLIWEWPSSPALFMFSGTCGSNHTSTFSWWSGVRVTGGGQGRISTVACHGKCWNACFCWVPPGPGRLNLGLAPAALSSVLLWRGTQPLTGHIYTTLWANVKR